jgi:hypothetical protein
MAGHAEDGSADGEVVWAGRSGGEPLSSEELLGVLSGLAASIQQDLAEDWEWRAADPRSGVCGCHRRA